jgi:hypothetical protein
MTRKPGQVPISISAWKPTLLEYFSHAISMAMVLKARLQVADQEYRMTWYGQGEAFQKRLMHEIFEGGREGQDRVAACLLPGWEMSSDGGEYQRIAKAEVLLDVMRAIV